VAQAIRHLCQARPIIPGQVTSAASAWQDFAKTLIGCAGSLIGERR
jgi:hypothetical protein